MADSVASSSSSEESEEDFLTLNSEANAGVDREALVRKKLLESFYGKSAVAAAGLDDNEQDDDEDSLDDETTPRGGKTVETDNLDAPTFDVQAHTKRHVVSSSVHTLLETEEKLALQVRTLDSTMQTLVYENYSRFIDATDAIRSIGVNVKANEEGISKLVQGMEVIDQQSKSVEDALGSLRDSVAEKIRVKRLLTRLDTLLKLPQTLQEQIAAGKYRTAAKSYLSAASILRKHSEGFESLRTIETDCNSILDDMKMDLHKKLLHWSGRFASTEDYDDDDAAEFGNEKASGGAPDPPKQMNEIFECAGTLFMLLDDVKDTSDTAEKLSGEDIRACALSASMRLLERLLDAHLIEVEELRFPVGGSTTVLDANSLHELGGSSLSDLQQLTHEPTGKSLVPCDVLDGILEAASLFASSFGQHMKDELVEFVSETFSSFLSHVRAILMEEFVQGAPGEAGEDGQGGSVEEAISGALSVMLQCVRELASGLALPEVGISVDYASNLVDQTIELTESMCRKGVNSKFLLLRKSVVRDCLVPFVDRAITERAELESAGKPSDRLIVQLASSTLSDCLQLVDDTIRSIFSGREGSPRAPDLPILSDAVHDSTYQFAAWLANAFEILASGESLVNAIEASIDTLDKVDVDQEGLLDADMQRLGWDGFSDEDGIELVSCRECERDSDFIMAIAELCRMAYASVSESLEQSISTHLGTKKKSKVFARSADSAGDKDSAHIEKWFTAVSTRLIVLFATNQGDDVGSTLCSDLSSVMIQEDIPVMPRDCVLQALEIMKTTRVACASFFGEALEDGELPELPDDSLSFRSSGLRKTGLQLDVERMFKENVTIYPHPSETIEASCDMIIFIVCKVAFRSLLEQTRMSRFSAAGFRQLQIDSDFLKTMVSHYIDSDFAVDGNKACDSLSSLLGDVITAAAERCEEYGLAEDDELRVDAKRIVRSFLANMTGSEPFLIKADVAG